MGKKRFYITVLGENIPQLYGLQKLFFIADTPWCASNQFYFLQLMRLHNTIRLYKFVMQA